MRNYDRQVHLASWEIEKKIANENPELEWHNSGFNSDTDQYDSKEAGLPDFTIKGTNLKIELQYVKQAYEWIYIQKRRRYECNSQTGTYGNKKNLKNTFLILTDGNWFKCLDLSKEREWKELDKFTGQRQEWERVYTIHQREFTIIDLPLWIALQKTMSTF